MRPASVFAVVLIVVGVLMLSIRSFTYFTTERVVGPLGYFAWDTNQPHTFFVSPVAGLAAVVVGIVLVMMSRSSKSI